MCFDVNIEIMTQNCLKSRHYQEFLLKQRAWSSLNANVIAYITILSELNYPVLNTKIHFD